MVQKNFKVAIITGEDSGDLLAADLISQMYKLNPNIEFFGVGGKRMKSAGARIISSNKEFAIMGLSEVIKKLPKLLKLRKKIVQNILAEKPDLFIGVDAPDLNFPIEKRLKKQGVKIVHYVSPSIWAWRPKRAEWISQLTDLILTLFPFEPKYYHDLGGKAQFVGHPLAQSIDLSIDKRKAKFELNLDESKPVLAVLPGSRSNELKAHTDIFLKTALKLKQKHPDLQIVSANTDDSKIDYIQQCAQRNKLKIKILTDATPLLKAADFALLASGTVSLEAMLCKTPMVVGYKISPITYSIVKTFNMMLLPYYSLPNVLFGGFLVPEILQNKMTVDNLYAETSKLFHEDVRLNMKSEFKRLHQDLLSPNMNAAKAVQNFLKKCQ